MRVKQLYLPSTNILITRFLSESGLAELVDFMPVGDHHDEAEQRYGNHIIRVLRVIKGTVRFAMRCAPRFDYARSSHKVEQARGRRRVRARLFRLPAHGSARHVSAAHRRSRRHGIVYAWRGRERHDVVRRRGRRRADTRRSARRRQTSRSDSGRRRGSGAIGSAARTTAGVGARWSTARRSCSSCSRAPSTAR